MAALLGATIALALTPVLPAGLPVLVAGAACAAWGARAAMTIWIGTAALAVVCVAMRVVVPLGLGDRRPEWLERGLALAVPASWPRWSSAARSRAAATRGRPAPAPPGGGSLVMIACRGPMLLVAVVAAARDRRAAPALARVHPMDSAAPRPYRVRDVVPALLERESESAALAAALDEARRSGRVDLVVGESGIGKTRLVRSVVERCDMPVLWGACDPLTTPRPLGPLRDIARGRDDELAAALAGGGREELLAALLATLDAPPSVLVVEDVHWIDAATLDVLALLGRRIAGQRGALVLTGWPEALGPRADVRRVLAAFPRDALADHRAGAAVAGARWSAWPPRAAATGPRCTPRPAATRSSSPRRWPRRPDEAVPTTVAAAVAARHAALPDAARAVLDVVSVVPGPTALTLLEGIAPGAADGLDACLQAEVLVARGEQARRLPPRARLPGQRPRARAGVSAGSWRRGCSPRWRPRATPTRRGWSTTRSAPATTTAVRRHAPVAARAAAADAAHRDALAHWEAALAAGCGAPGAGGRRHRGLPVRPRRARGRGAARAAGRRRGRRRPAGVGHGLRALSRALWWGGRSDEAVVAGDRAIAVLGALSRPAASLPRRSAAVRSWRCWPRSSTHAIALGERAAAMAAELGDEETLVHARTNVGTALTLADPGDRGPAMLRDAHARAAAAGLDDHAGRAIVNLASSTTDAHGAGPDAVARIDDALAFCRARRLDGYTRYVHGVRAGRPDRARRPRRRAGRRRRRARVRRGAQRRLGLARRHRARPAADAARRAGRGRAGADRGLGARAAARWSCSGWSRSPRRAPSARGSRTTPRASPRRAPPSTSSRAAPAVRRREGELALWLRRAGAPVDAGARRPAPEPYALALAGDDLGAAAAWRALGCDAGGRLGAVRRRRPRRRCARRWRSSTRSARPRRRRASGGACARRASGGSRAGRARRRGPIRTG